MTVKQRTKFHITLSGSFVAAMLTLVYLFIPIPFLYYLITAYIIIVGNWVFLTVYAYRRPTVRLRVYEYSVVVWLCIALKAFLVPEIYLLTLVIMTVHGLFVTSIAQKNANDEFAIGITSRERQNPFYLRWYKKVQFEEVYIPPSLVGNKDIQETLEWHRKGCLCFLVFHALGVAEIITFAIGLDTLTLFIDMARLGVLHMVSYFAIKIIK